MSDEIDPGIPTPGTSQSKTNWRPIGLTILSSFLLAATSCFGAIEFHDKAVMSIFAVIFLPLRWSWYAGACGQLAFSLKS
jgi:hypothetical protein